MDIPRVYAVSSSRIFENYGEGVALAYEAGVDLVDMEMVQFHPTGMVWPEKALGTLATEAIRGEGGILLNSKGERYMKNYYPERMELGPRDIVARANYNEIIAGRGTATWWSLVRYNPSTQRKKFWTGSQLCTNSSKILMELTYPKRKWRLDLLHIIRWVE